MSTAPRALFPIMMQGQRLPVGLQPPRFGAHTQELLHGLGYGAAEIDGLKDRAAVA
jgi:crotonobetainyl-CoA:carnitine CoA-transferase CaiB-like acyl-CoA transferase